jgi:hypothetical protein
MEIRSGQLIEGMEEHEHVTTKLRGFGSWVGRNRAVVN